jgi:N-methylhydantoinase B/oxoprolinase/acetone carboxylase alpha subunit
MERARACSIARLCTHDSGHGGWGACATHDGAGPFRTMAHGDTRISPLELQEASLPIRIEEFSLREDSAGAPNPLKFWLPGNFARVPPRAVRGPTSA